MYNQPIPFRRSIIRWRILTVFLICFTVWNVLDVRATYKLVHATQDPKPERDAHNSKSQRDTSVSERVFIASNQHNSGSLLRSHWNQAILDLSNRLGPSNVYVSIYESGSTDDTKEALADLDKQLEELGVGRSIVLDGWTHEEELAAAVNHNEGWIRTPRSGLQLRRIPFLSRLRNLCLDPLHRLVKEGNYFDRVLFLNDVVFTADDVMQVLQTNDGDYAAACSLDFADKVPSFYDSFALFDTNGDQYWSRTWPYFRHSQQRDALIRKEPVPIKSCWNGIAAFDAEPFMNSTNPLRFRAVPDSLAQLHVEASECCLIHADNPVSESKGVWLNPTVRVGYTPQQYEKAQKIEENLTHFKIFRSLWYIRIWEWAMLPFSSPKDWVVKPRFRAWRNSSSGQDEPGLFCLIDEMQVLTSSSWTYIRWFPGVGIWKTYLT